MKHIAVITKRPIQSGKNSIPDGGICGNGDLCAVLGGGDGFLRVYLAKSDLWCGSTKRPACGIKPLGFADVPVPPECDGVYRCEQDMDLGELRVVFVKNGSRFRVTVRVSRTENSVVIETDGAPAGTPVLGLPEDAAVGENGFFEKDGIRGIYRVFDGEGYSYKTSAYAAMRQVTERAWYIFVSTCHDRRDPEKTAADKALDMTAEKLEKLKKAHYGAWKKFWSVSSFSVTDAALENGWYASQYFLAVSAGNKKFAPGLYGNFITVENPSWSGDYHLNYNYQAPFYAACSSNHTEFTDCYHAPLEEFLPQAREDAGKFGCRGIFFPVGLLPRGQYSENDKQGEYSFKRLYMGQMSCAVHAADIMIFRWKTTRDTDYARAHAYPFVKETLRFFEDYAVFEDGRYSVPRDAAHEVPYYRDDFTEEKYKKVINDKNNVLTLGLLRLALEAGIDMAETLGTDAEERAVWRDMLAKLSPFPTFIKRGRRVFRYTESGMAWNDTNDIGVQHIFPASCIGLSSDPRLLRIARNSFSATDRWMDDNAPCSYFPCAARLGIKPELITAKLREHNEKFCQQNLLFRHAGGCLENCSIMACTLNEMALQSFEGVIRLFPVWDKKLGCRFENLRAYGAFLVSSSITMGVTGDTSVFCEKGGQLKIYNPFPCSVVTRPTEKFETAADIIILDTVPGETITITKQPVVSAH